MVLKCLIDDLNILETKGIQLLFIGVQLFGSVIQVPGDTIALNNLQGFVKSFSATHWCSFSLIDKEEIQSVFIENNHGLNLYSKVLHTENCNVLHKYPALPTIYAIKKNLLI